MSRIDARFAQLQAQGRGGLVPFVTAGDPDLDTSEAILAGLADAGADLIELGMPFTDPMADGPAIQEASLRALKAGAGLRKILPMAKRFRSRDDDTPLILMGYFNPIMAYGIEAFVADAADAGVDGLIVVDLPPEEDRELREPAAQAGIAIIRLATPTTDSARLPAVLDGAAGFVYYVSVAGVTGGKSALATDVGAAVQRVRAASDLPVAVGFGIRTPDQAAGIAEVSDAAVVGSAIASRIKDNLDQDGRPKAGLVDDVLGFVRDLSAGVHRSMAAE